MKKFLLLLGIVSTLTMGAYQMIPEQVSVGSSKPDASASLHLTGVTKGFIPNKLTTTQRNAIPSPARGLLIYNTNLDEVQLYNGSGWITVGAGGAGGVDAWATATVYAVDDVVILNQELYLCQNNHTSGVFATDLANGEWLIISDDVSSTGTITDTAIPRYVGTSGNVIDSSGVTIDNSNNIAGASSLAIGGSLDTSSILDAVSTSKGTRPCPSMSEVQRDAIGTPATGLCIFNTTTNTLNIYNGTAWVSAGGGLSSWETAKPYKIGDIVIESKQIYRALTNHTSGTFATDLAASRWEALPQELKTDSNVQFANLNATGTTTLNTGLTGPLKASSGVISSSAVDLTSEVTGTLPIANGGTGSATQNFVDLTTNQTVAGEKTFSNTLKSDSIQTTGSSGVVIKNSSGATVADFGPANTTNASIAGGLNTGGNISATGTVTGSNLSGTNTGDTEIGNDAGNIGVAKEFDFPNSQVVQTDSTNKKFRIESGNNNELYNGGFEAEALAIGWTVLNATSSSSATRIEGSKSLSLALTGALSLSQSSTINAAQKSGVQMVASIWVNSSDVSDLQLCSLKNGAEDKCTVTGGYVQGSGWRQLTVSFIGDATSNGLKLKSTDTTGTVLVDQAYVGIGSPIVNLSIDPESISYTGYLSKSGSSVRFKTLSGNSSGNLITSDNTTFTKYTALKRVTATACYTVTYSSSRSDTQVVLYNSSGAAKKTWEGFYIQSGSTGGANAVCGTSIMEIGDYFIASETSATPTDTNSTSFSITVNALDVSKAYVASAGNQGLEAGTIIPTSAATCPAGTLAADGSPVSRTTYSELFAKIGVTHGQGDGSTTFNVPDYRGRFLRGVDGAAGNDPDKASRTAMNTGGNTGNNVGSVQGDVFASHTHNYTTNATISQGSPGSANRLYLPNTDATATTATGGNETRPKNAYVNYCIRTTSQSTIVGSFQGYNETPGTSRVEIFSVAYGTTNVSTICSSSPCFTQQIGSAVTSVTRASAGAYTMNLSKTYTNLICSLSTIQNTANSVGTRAGPLACTNCNSISFTTGVQGSSNLDTSGTLVCHGN